MSTRATSRHRNNEDVVSPLGGHRRARARHNNNSSPRSRTQQQQRGICGKLGSAVWYSFVGIHVCFYASLLWSALYYVLLKYDYVAGNLVEYTFELTQAAEISVQFVLTWTGVFVFGLHTIQVAITYVLEATIFVSTLAAQTTVELVYTYPYACGIAVLSLLGLLLLFLLQQYIRSLQLISKLKYRLLVLRHKYEDICGYWSTKWQATLQRMTQISPVLASLLPHLVFLTPVASAVVLVPEFMFTQIFTPSMYILISGVIPTICTLYYIAGTDLLPLQYWLKFWTLFGLLKFAEIYLVFDVLHGLNSFYPVYIILYLWLLAPLTGGLELVYHTVLRCFPVYIQIRKAHRSQLKHQQRKRDKKKKKKTKTKNKKTPRGKQQHTTLDSEEEEHDDDESMSSSSSSSSSSSDDDEGGEDEKGSDPAVVLVVKVLQLLTLVKLISASTAEKLTRTVRENGVLLLFVLFYITPAFLTSIAAYMVLLLYPSLKSAQYALGRTATAVTEYKLVYKWLKYWTIAVFPVLTILQGLNTSFIASLPFYTSFLLSVALWLTLPYFDGANLIYTCGYHQIVTLLQNLEAAPNNVLNKARRLSTPLLFRSRAKTKRRID